MSPQPDEVLLHYHLVDKIGEGGMGVVWRAVDTTLDREVAIKILPDAFVDDRERLARFEREAKLLASLNHPNLATVFGVHNFGGTRFLAMELIPGEDLAQRLARGPLPIAESLDVARQMAEALEAAHQSGVVHRDLKPANIKVSSDGRVKILDFGLAKAMASSPGSNADLTSSPTMTSAGSVAGVVLGTAAYMSPEQARGQNVDQRSDIWSFGCVVWECLTGQRLFGEKTVSDSIGAILHNDPDWSLLPKETPAAVRRTLRRCLAKDPRDRLHHIADARIELEETESTPLILRSSSRGYRIAVGLLAIALAVSLTAALLPFLRQASERSESGFDNPLAGARFTRITDFEGSEFDASISPNGRFVAFISDRDGPFEAFVGQIGAGEFRKLTSDEREFEVADARAPVRSIGFNADGSEIWFGGGPWLRVRSMPLLGGPMRNFLGEHVVNVAWSPDGEHIAYHERLAGDPLFIANHDGSNSRRILSPPVGTHQHYPTWSVDGRWIYLSRGRPATLEMDLWRVRVNGDDLQQLTRGKLDVSYPTPIDQRTVLYSSHSLDGGPPDLRVPDGGAIHMKQNLDFATTDMRASFLSSRASQASRGSDGVGRSA